MTISRLPRFRRAAVAAPMQLTPRDQEIVRLVHRHRFLRSSQIVALVGANAQPLLRRLKLLYHHGYLERPRAQIEYFHRGGSRPIIYGLGNRGAAFLRQEFGEAVNHINWGDKNRSVGGIFLEHALLVSDFMVMMELACRKMPAVQLITEEDLRREAEGKTISASYHWNVNLNDGRTLGVVPDNVFALEYGAEGDSSNRAFFFVEADRGTMPVRRRNLAQTSFYRKLLAYEATWAQSIHRTRFGFNRFRVLTVTTSRERVTSLIDACSLLKRGHRLFLFACKDALKDPQDIFSQIWKTGHGETSGLLN